MGKPQPGQEPSAQEVIFAFVVEYKRAHDGVSPSFREIGRACSMSVSTVNYYLTLLELENRVRVTGRRKIEIVGGTWSLSEEEGATTDGQEVTPTDKRLDEDIPNRDTTDPSGDASEARGSTSPSSKPNHGLAFKRE